jgi:regulation of enolase protein 1 (concanavalin A-like superfamily)
MCLVIILEIMLTSGLDQSSEQRGKAGLMIRESMAPGSKTFGVFIQGRMSVVNLYRANTDDWMQSRGEQPGVSNRVWLKLTKRMNAFTAYRSSDGVEWTIVGTPQTLSMNATDLRIGLGLTSSTNWRQIEATFDKYDTSNYYYPSAAPSLSEAPSRDIPHNPARDIGRTYNRKFPSDVGLQKSNYIIMAAGVNIWGSEDSFTFVNFTVTGDFDMTAKVTSVLAKNSWVKFGLMARDSLDPKSKQICPMFAPNQGSMIQLRGTYGGSTSNFNQTNEKPKSIWLRLKREGNVFNSFKSFVGTKLEECSWQLMRRVDASTISFNTTGTMQIGMAVTSHNATEYAIGEFDQFKITLPA